MTFIVAETTGLLHQVTDGRTTDDPVPAQPTTGERDLWCEDEEAISLRCNVLVDDDDAPLFAVIAACALR